MARRRRRRGEGSIFPSRDPRTGRRFWVARVSLGVVEGRRIGKKVVAASEAEARRELERLQRAYGAGTAPAARTLDDYLRAWLSSHRSIRESTRVSYAGHISHHISPLLGGIPVARLRPADIDRLIADRLRAGLSAATVARVVTTLRIALGRGVKRGELAVNPAAQVDLPRIEQAPIRALTEAEADRLVEAFDQHWLGPLVRLLAGSGLRLGEALALDQGDVFPDEGYVRLRRSKTSIRAVPLSDDGVAAIRAALAAAPRRGPGEPLFFGPRRRERLNAGTVSHAVPRILEHAGLARLTPHGFRHAAATLLVAQGVPMRVVAEQLGHRDPGLTARVYAHVAPESQRQAAKLLNRRRKA